MTPIKQYSWTAPKFFAEQEVRFLNHTGSQRVGVISFVQTTYSYADAHAVHVYHIRVKRADPTSRGGSYFNLWINEDNILDVEETE